MMAGVDVGFGQAYRYRESAGAIVYVVVLELVQIVSALLCLGLCRRWSEQVPRWVPSLGGRDINPKLPLVAGALGNALLYTIIFSVATLFPIALLQQPPGWTPTQGMSTTQTIIFTLCYSPMLLWPIALTVALIGFQRRHWPRRN